MDEINLNAPLSGLLTTALTGATSNIPSKQDLILYYVEAVLGFWIIGGIILYLVSKASK